MQRISEAGTLVNTFISNPVTPVSIKAMCNGVQDVHPKNLFHCFVLENSSRKQNLEIIFCDMVEEGMVVMKLQEMN